ncbi:MAG: DUF3606 domain-containing protein [Acidobacteria bacterium]|nr:DUF3606 domain-containing protein [Acidobacteriota bacterium]
MTDHPSVPEAAPTSEFRISLEDRYQRQFWAQHFGVSVKSLRKAVESVGPDLKAVRAYIGKWLRPPAGR